MAKVYTNCGKKLEQNAVVCLNCGVLFEIHVQSNTGNIKKRKGLPV